MKQWYDRDWIPSERELKDVVLLCQGNAGTILLRHLDSRCLDLMETFGLSSGPDTQESVWSNRGRYQAFREIMDLISPPDLDEAMPEDEEGVE